MVKNSVGDYGRTLMIEVQRVHCFDIRNAPLRALVGVQVLFAPLDHFANL